MLDHISPIESKIVRSDSWFYFYRSRKSVLYIETTLKSEHFTIPKSIGDTTGSGSKEGKYFTLLINYTHNLWKVVPKYTTDVSEITIKIYSQDTVNDSLWIHLESICEANKVLLEQNTRINARLTQLEEVLDRPNGIGSKIAFESTRQLLDQQILDH